MGVSKSAGSFAGSFLSSPFGLGLLGVGALAVGLFVFRDKISEFFQKGFDGLFNIELPSFTLENPIDITFPNIGDSDKSILEAFTTINKTNSEILAQLQGLTPLGTPENPATSPTSPTATDVILTDPNLTQTQRDELLRIISPLDPNDPNNDPNLFNPEGVTCFGCVDSPEGIPITDPIAQIIEPIRSLVEGSETIIVPQGDEFNLAGGTFIGGTTTFGDNLVDSLTEVLNIFPDLSASQARDVLEENPDLTSSQFRLINPDVINISNEVEQDQIFNVSSGGFTGLTPEQISKLLTGGDINNF